MPAVPYVERDELPEEFRYLYDDNENGELNVYRALGNNPEVLQSLMRWGTTAVAASGLPRQDAEVVLLATARALSSHYLWDLHVPLAEAMRFAGDYLRRHHDFLITRFRRWL